MQNQAITLGNTTIHQDVHGRFCLNDLHHAAGGLPKHKPSEWLRSQQTKEIVDELSKAGIPALVSIKGGNARGSYACRELVYVYATWISPAFFVKVVRTYDALVTEKIAPQAPALPQGVFQTHEHYQAERARLEAELEKLAATPVLMTTEALERLTGERVRVGKKDYLVAEMVNIFDHYGIPRKVAEEITGLNNNNIRQHALIGRRRKGGAA
jgi:pyrrolidone-carboxylate peptidase